ncbi:Ig-like domain-containing protein [Streptomyces sp. NPDC048197]|uniref:Ig-like domain-containing protein n=1 Tax=Streptomyces sp. NPDC048197 TaxID=3365511 RepID=UPI003719E201
MRDTARAAGVRNTDSPDADAPESKKAAPASGTAPAAQYCGIAERITLRRSERWLAFLLRKQMMSEAALGLHHWRCAMRRRALSAAAISGLLAIPAFSPVAESAESSASGRTAIAQAAMAPTDQTKECPEGDTLQWATCTNAEFMVEPGERMQVRILDVYEVASADFAVFAPASQSGPLDDTHDVGENWRHLYTNHGDRPQPVILKASPVYPFDDGKTIKVDIRIRVVPLTAYTEDIRMQKNTVVYVKVNDLTLGKQPIYFDKAEKPKHGKLQITRGHDRLRYKPDKNFKGTDEIWYTVKNDLGEKAEARLTFNVW